MHKYKKEFIISSWILAGLIIAVASFYTVTPFRSFITDAYHSIFKRIISDRVLEEKGKSYSNITYCAPGDSRQTLDIFLPDRRGDSRVPLVIFIHGGGWRLGDKANREVAFYGESLLKNNIAIASINYRLAPAHTYPTQNDDIACAIKYLQNHASTYQFSDRWAIFGDSAGAQLGALAMTDKQINRPLVAFVGFYGPYDLSLQTTRSPHKDVDAISYTNHARDAQQASPINHPARQGAEYWLYHGTKDRIVSINQSQRFYTKLLDEGIPAHLTIVQNASHAFGSLSRPSSQEIRSTLTQSLVEILED